MQTALNVLIVIAATAGLSAFLFLAGIPTAAAAATTLFGFGFALMNGLTR